MNRTGKAGEQAAARFLAARGYRIVERNFSCRFGEVDIILEGRGYIVFCEVKTRNISPLVSGEESIDYHKRQKIIRTAEQYLSTKGADLQPRFDVVVVEKRGIFFHVKRHIEDAFQ